MTASPDALHVDAIQVRYPNGALGIREVSVRVAPGQVVAMFGPNGAGKTTTVRAASGFLRAEGAKVVRGTVSIAGTDVTNREPHRIAGLGVAFVPERRKVFPNLTVAENLVAIGKIPDKVRRAERQEYVYELFPVLASRQRTAAGRLSGGQQQMLALGRSLMGGPSLLIVDEMTLGLHHSLQEPLFVAVRRVAADGTAVLLVDESTGLALDVADYCYLMSGGQIRREGPAEDFRGNELLAAGYVE